VTAHRSTAVDEQTDRSRGRSELPRDDLGGRARRQPAVGSLERPIEVEIAVGRTGDGDHPAGTATPGLTDPPELRQQRPGEPARLAAQRRVGRDRQVGEQRQRGVGVGLDRGAQRSLVECADLG
jgi:hypothetical protein